MTTAAKRTINMVHYPLGDVTDPRELQEYLDEIDTGVAAAVAGPASDNRASPGHG